MTSRVPQLGARRNQGSLPTSRVRDTLLFYSDIYDFGLLLLKMQVQRHDADYNPKADTFLESEVLAELAEARLAIAGFCAASNKDRRGIMDHPPQAEAT